MPLEIALYQPDMAPNAGAIARLCACFGLRMTIIEPAGFVYTDSAFRRAGMDYLEKLELNRAVSWPSFLDQAQGRRIVLASTKAAEPLHGFAFTADDILLFGRETAGVPADVHATIQYRIRIPMHHGIRSINLAQSVAIVASEAMRQTGGFAKLA